MTKTRPTISPIGGVAPAAPASTCADGVEVGGAGEAVDQRGAVEQHARGERAEDEVLQPGLGRAHVVAVEGGDDVERQALQLEAEIERDQVVGRDHQHHAERWRAGPARGTRSGRCLALDVVQRRSAGERRADQHQHLDEDGEGVDDEHAAEASTGPRAAMATTSSSVSTSAISTEPDHQPVLTAPAPPDRRPAERRRTAAAPSPRSARKISGSAGTMSGTSASVIGLSAPWYGRLSGRPARMRRVPRAPVRGVRPGCRPRRA